MIMKSNNLVDKEILDKFGRENSVDIDMMIKYLKSLKEKLPEMDKKSPFTKDKPRDFKISLEGQDVDELNENISSFFSNCINWKSSKTHFNITPPVTIPSVVASSVASLLNPNGIWDIASGSFAELEMSLVSYFSKLVEWENSGGVFVFGGTATNMYAIKIGISTCMSNAHQQGVDNQVYIISNDEGHSCHLTLCNWLGLGTEKCVRLNTNKEGVLLPKDTLTAAEKLMKEGKKIACIILNSGTNFNGMFDDIKAVKFGIDKLVKKYNLDYIPHIHSDSVIGWVFLLFKDYDFKKNELNFPSDTLKKIEKIAFQAFDIKYADSFGIDFHKTGFCPYLSSLFITKDSKDWNKITGDTSVFTHQAFNYGDYKPGQYTLECSRAVNGAISSYTTLNSLGINGIRKILANFLYIAKDLRDKLDESDSFSVCNRLALGWATLFIVKETFESPNFDRLYEEKDKNIIETNNQFHKDFYSFLTSKYNKKLPWNIGFSKCYKKNKFGIPISTLKNYPMSPYINIQDNIKYVEWLSKNLEEFRNEKN